MGKPAREKGLLYKSKSGIVPEDCLSLSADDQVFCPRGDASLRTPLCCYRDYIAAFCKSCGDHIGTTVCEIQVGMGPCGELRYPSYMLSDGWEYPGVGVFMCNDDAMQGMMKAARVTEPLDLHFDKNAMPDDTAFFKSATDTAETNEAFCEVNQGALGVGPTFLEWYTQVLVAHGESVLNEAICALQEAGFAGIRPDKLTFSVKVSGIHWHTLHPSRAAEACAGYNCSSGPKADAYKEI